LLGSGHRWLELAAKHALAGTIVTRNAVNVVATPCARCDSDCGSLNCLCRRAIPCVQANIGFPKNAGWHDGSGSCYPTHLRPPRNVPRARLFERNSRLTSESIHQPPACSPRRRGTRSRERQRGRITTQDRIPRRVHLNANRHSIDAGAALPLSAQRFAGAELGRRSER
jgi:hypothetical protein